MIRAASATQSASMPGTLTLGISWRALGLAIATLGPALFWTGMLVLFGNVAGYVFSGLFLATVATAITVFLAVIVTALPSGR